jgi:uncharacterized protein DUF5947
MEDSSRLTFASLQALLKKKPASAPGERCDFCAVPLGAEHSHLVDMTSRRILCACRPCYLVMEPTAAANGRYKAVPWRYLALGGVSVDDARWDALQIPIGLAFFFFNSAEGTMVAFYPGPAGATQSLLPLESWEAIAADTPALTTLAPDVEAVILQRDKDATRCFIAPIDRAYELVGLIRTSWRGFDGGDEVRGRIDTFFADLLARSEGRVTSPLGG